MLDQLSGGRLELGISRGVSPHELACFNVDAGATREIFDEALLVFRKAMTDPVLNHEGRHFRYHDVQLPIRPLQQPYPPLWYPTHNPDSVDYAARHGFHYAGLGPAAFLRQLIDRYRATWNANLHAADRINGHVAAPRLGTLRQIYVADTDADAMRTGRAAYAHWYESITALWHRRGDTAVDTLFDLERGLAGETVLFGSPATVRDAVQRLVAESGITYLGCAFAWGSLTHAQARQSLALFAREVMPALR